MNSRYGIDRTDVLANEATPDQVKKGDFVQIVYCWNFSRNAKRDFAEPDVYVMDICTVEAIGKKVMRLRRNSTGEMIRENIPTDFKTTGGKVTFCGYVATLGNGYALAVEMNATDPKAAGLTRYLSYEEARQWSKDNRRRTVAA